MWERCQETDMADTEAYHYINHRSTYKSTPMKSLISILITACLAALIAACSSSKSKVKQASTIDSTLQVTVDSILRNKMEELRATAGQVIVMEVESCEVKASVSLDSTFHATDTEILQESGLLRVATLYAQLATGKVHLSDTIDTGEGILPIGKDTLYDHNWYHGGYGVITMRQGFEVNSKIASYLASKQAFSDKKDYAAAIRKSGYEVESKDFIYKPLGYGIKLTPMQNLKFFTALAKGKLGNQAVTDSVKSVLDSFVYRGLGKPAQADSVRVAGATGGFQSPDEEKFILEFCGYFPADKPQYSVIVVMNKSSLPASSSLMAGDVFSQIANYITERGY